MATFTGKSSSTDIDFVLTDDDVDETAVDDIFGGAATVHSLFLDAPSGTTHYKLYNNADPTVGTTHPDFIFRVTEPVVWTIVDGVSFDNFSYAAVQEDGTGGTTAPAVTCKLHAVVR
jgi:hypothetical protein